MGVEQGYKLCSYEMHVLPATTEYFWRDCTRKDGLDCWCKKCRRIWRKATPYISKVELGAGPLVLVLPSGREWPKTEFFTSWTRRIADQQRVQGRQVVVVRSDYEGPVWKWREWEQAAWLDIGDFLKENDES